MLGVGRENRVALCTDLDDASTGTRMAVGLLVCCITPFPCSRFLFRANEKHMTTMMCTKRVPPEVILHKEKNTFFDISSVMLGVELVAAYT